MYSQSYICTDALIRTGSYTPQNALTRARTHMQVATSRGSATLGEKRRILGGENKFSKVLRAHALYCKDTRALTFQNFGNTGGRGATPTSNCSIGTAEPRSLPSHRVPSTRLLLCPATLPLLLLLLPHCRLHPRARPEYLRQQQQRACNPIARVRGQEEEEEPGGGKEKQEPGGGGEERRRHHTTPPHNTTPPHTPPATPMSQPARLYMPSSVRRVGVGEGGKVVQAIRRATSVLAEGRVRTVWEGVLGREVGGRCHCWWSLLVTRCCHFWRRCARSGSGCCTETFATICWSLIPPP